MSIFTKTSIAILLIVDNPESLNNRTSEIDSSNLRYIKFVLRDVISNDTNNGMIIFASILGAIVATGLLALNPSTITNASAQPYGDQYGYDNNYLKKRSDVNKQEINCVSSNINVNGIESNIKIS